MRTRLAHMLVMLAARSIGARRGEWGAAMRAELDAAIEDGRPMSFAIGCLLAAWRQLPVEREGRFVLVSHALVLGLIVPIAALSFTGALFGYPYLATGSAGLPGLLAGNRGQTPLLNAGDWAIAPSLTLLVLAQAPGHLLLGWSVLEGDWARAGAIGRAAAAMLTTYAIVTGLLAIDVSRLLAPAAVLVTELSALLALARWRDQLSGAGLVDNLA